MSASTFALALIAFGALFFFGKRALVGPQKILARIALVCYPAGFALNSLATSGGSPLLAPVATVFLLLGIVAAGALLAGDIWATYKRR